MNPEPIERNSLNLPVPPSYEPFVAATISLQAEYVVSPLAMVELFAWDDEDDN